MQDTAFVTTGGATYTARPIDASTAAHFGCDGSDWMLVGRHGHMIGTMTATGTVPGRSVRVPGWSAARRGVRAVFVPWGTAANGEPVPGWLGDDA